MSCEQVTLFDEAITAKDAEIDSLRVRITELEAAQVLLLFPRMLLP